MARYWDNICSMQQKQTAKGIKTYGQTLEQNQIPDFIARTDMAQEEMIDFLMYTEWMKESFYGSYPFVTKTLIIKKPSRFWSNTRFLKYIHDTFPDDMCFGWADKNCNSYEIRCYGVGGKYGLQ